MIWLLAMIFYILIYLILFFISLPQREFILLPLVPSVIRQIPTIQLLFYILLSAVLYASFYYTSRLYRLYLEGKETTPVWFDNLSLIVSSQNIRVKMSVSVALLILLLTCLPFIIMGRLQPAYWVLGVVIWTSITFAHEGEKAEEKEKKAPEPPKRLTPEEMIEYLRSRSDYRGQIVYIEDIPRIKRVPAKENKLMSMSSALADAVHNLGIGRLYEHQDEVVRYFTDRRNVLNLTPVGTGRSTIADLLAISTVGINCKNVLYIYPSYGLGEKRFRKFRKLTEETHWNYSFTTSRLLEPEEELNLKEEMPEIVFTTPESLHRRILPFHKRHGWQTFLRDLDLVILEDADIYTGVYGSHVSMLIRRLRGICGNYGAHPVFISSCLPFRGARSFVEDLVGLEFVEVSHNSAGASAKKLVLWNPPLMRVKDSPKLKRKDYFDEATGLVADVQLQKFRCLLLSKSVRLTMDDISSMKAAIIGRLSKLLESAKSDSRIPIISEEDQFVASSLSTMDLQLSDFDSVVITGFPGSVRMIRQEIDSVGTEDAKVLTFIVLPQAPLSQYYVKHASQIFGESGLMLPLLTLHISHPRIMRDHLLCYASELPLYITTCEELFGDRAKILIEEITGEDNEIVKDANYDQVNLSVIGNDFYFVRREGQERTLGSVETSRVCEMFFLNAVVVYDGARYRVKEIDRGSKIVWVEPEQDHVMTEKLNRLKVTLEEGYITETISIGGGLGFVIGLGKAHISEDILGYVEYTAENVDPETAESVELKPKMAKFSEPFKRSFETGAFFLKLPGSCSLEILHSLVHCIRISLPAFIQYEKRDLEVAFIKESKQLEGNAIVVYDNSLYELFLVRTVRNSIEDILKLSYDILVSCSCDNGCASCLYTFDCREMEMHNRCFHKNGAIELLGKMLGHDYEKKIQERTQGVHSIRTLENMLKEIQKVLNESIGLEITDAIIYLADGEELQRLAGRDVIGVCIGLDIYIILGLIERRAKDVLAHEYGHSWEHLYMADELKDPGVIPFNGKLITEGFAQWVSAKFLQRDGLWEQMANKERDLWGWDEYGEGYHLMTYIEERFGGAAAVVSFMRLGFLEGYEGYDITRLISESGVEDVIKKRGTGKN
jgi:DEAD/DEAH box helicase domain-containing protein